jgi:phosphoribosylformimino-5-aminoimidazole carboxamide ribotide isomerase
MNIIPVLDLMNGQVVHARHGNRHEYRPIKSVLTDSSEPLVIAQALLALYPFKQLYIADINAIEKTGSHQKFIDEIANHFPQLEIWLDAGFDNEASIKSFSASNISPVLGSESLNSIEKYQALSSASFSCAILSLDYRDDEFQGRQELLTDISLWPKDLIVMSLNKVGSYTGPDLAKLSAIKQQSKQSKIYAAGGVRGYADLEALQALGISGALVASALHNGVLSANILNKLSIKS